MNLEWTVLAGLVSLGLLGASALAFWRVRRESRTLASGRRRGDLAVSAVEAFEMALIVLDDEHPTLVAGEAGLELCATLLGVIPPHAAGVIDALAASDEGRARQLRGLTSDGAPCAFEVHVAEGSIIVDGRTSGALAWLRLCFAGPSTSGLPSAARLAALLDTHAEPVWLGDTAGQRLWVNRAWLSAAEAGGLAPDAGFDAVVEAAARTGRAHRETRIVGAGPRRRILDVRIEPLSGGAAVWTADVTDAREARSLIDVRREAHEQLLQQIGDAVAVFDADRRLVFHNAAFATLWGLEPGWLADQPKHGEILDRLRQRRRLPETVDYAKFKAAELARHRSLTPSQEAIWRLPGERTLRVVSLPHPLGDLCLLFSDITPELRLKTQFNELIQVQRATLDKLTDAVAVFGSDARLKLHNEAFETFWSATSDQLAAAADFDGVVELCVRRLHDLRFWRDLKGRITDPDPRVRAALAEELVTGDGRMVAFQSRPLPDGATLVSFTDVTDARRLEEALQDREAALGETERLKREFVGSVSYELRTPLTTIVGYAELLEREGGALSPRARGHIGAVRAAATQLARSINAVLDMAAADAGETSLDIADVEVSALLTSAAGRWSEAGRDASVAVQVAPDAEGGLIRGDARRLAQVLDHLIENALRHTPPGGRISLSAQGAQGEMRLQVTDTGRGIPFHVQAHIFDRFTGQDLGGPGLGLALVKALVELHGGWVALESEPGAGASFTCHLPETAPAPEDRPELF